MQKLKIIWDQEASTKFSEHIKYIRNDSPKNADRVKKDILDVVNSLLIYPEKFPPDKNKIYDVKNEYRAFEKHRLRVSYRILDDVVRIIRVRHTKQNPQSY